MQIENSEARNLIMSFHIIIYAVFSAIGLLF